MPVAAIEQGQFANREFELLLPRSPRFIGGHRPRLELHGELALATLANDREAQSFPDLSRLDCSPQVVGILGTRRGERFTIERYE